MVVWSSQYLSCRKKVAARLLEMKLTKPVPDHDVSTASVNCTWARDVGLGTETDGDCRAFMAASAGL